MLVLVGAGSQFWTTSKLGVRSNAKVDNNVFLGILQAAQEAFGRAAARTENRPSLRLLKQVVNEAAGEKNTGGVAFSPAQPRAV